MEWLEYSVNKASKGDKNYPDGLLLLNSPPGELYHRGELSTGAFKKSIAIVGSRRMTRYGASIIDKFVSHFVSNGITTISGYMYGVDTEVHGKTVEYGGKTAAVMGGGINQPYPPENDKLYTKILNNHGVVMSEYNPEAKPKLWMYPQRNRIVAALATIGILVIEASENSGSLITVKHAVKLKKKIYAVPGPITSSVSSGTNYLIKEGIAQMVTEPSDVIAQIVKHTKKKNNIPADLNDTERKIYLLLQREEMSIDEITVTIQEEMVTVSAILSMMALKGIVSEAGGRYFVV